MCLVGCCVSSPHGQRKIYAWANGNPEAAAQLENASWAGLFDGVQASCGVRIVSNSTSAQIVVNETTMAGCAALRRSLAKTGGSFEVWVGAVPGEWRFK